MATPTFDGDNLVITLAAPVAGVVDLDVQVDLYSDWKEWMQASFQNMGYPPAFRTIAGDPLVGAANVSPYFFIRNDLGWRIRPFEADASINIVGNLIPQDASLPIAIETNGAFTVLGFGLQPQTQTIAVGSGVLPADIDAIEAQIFARVVEGGFTFEQLMRLLAASAAGDITQAGDGSYTITGVDETTARILGQLGANNSRDITATDAT